MYIRFASLLPIAALATIVAAAPAELEARASSECTTGTLQCCDSTSSTSDPWTVLLLQLLGVTSPTDLVGISCSGNAGSSTTCTQQSVCCNGDTFVGLVVIGCSPINIYL